MIILMIIIGIIIYRFYFNRAAIVKRKLNKTSEKKISDFKDNEVAKIIGKVIYIGKPLIAPLSGRKCVYYHILIEEFGLVGSGKYAEGTWCKFIEKEVGGNVVIKEENDYAIIETELVKNYLVRNNQFITSPFNENVTAVLEAYLNEHDYDSVSFR
jgi:hypothetical protein